MHCLYLSFYQLFMINLNSVKTETHKFAPPPGNERGYIEIKDDLILSHGEDNRIPPHTLMMDVTMTHDHYERTRINIRHHRQLHVDRSDPIVFLSVTVRTSGQCRGHV